MNGNFALTQNPRKHEFSGEGSIFNDKIEEIVTSV